MRRREFLLKSALASSALLVSPKITDYFPSKGKKPKSVIVIGAGFAGLAAAYKLSQLGIKVT
ncbi:MAG: FAD-dependent oxidoreductase, partial [Saprospiraceae bacterium]